MNKKRRNRSNLKYEVISNKIIRCSLHMRPVLQQETCSKFINGQSQETQPICKNCKYSF